MSGTIEIMPARTDHVAALVEFNRAMARESEDKGLDEAVLTRGVRNLLGRSDEGFYLVAECDGTPVGSLMVTYEWSDWRNGRFWWIQSVYVRPEFRRKGVYRALHERVRMLAQEDSDACGIRLYVERENTGAMATYRKLGMSETGYRLYEEEF